MSENRKEGEEFAAKFLCTWQSKNDAVRRNFGMTTKTLMTWRPESKRWVKKHGGKTIYAGIRTLMQEFPELVKAPTKEGSREAANAFWERYLSGKTVTPKLPADYERLVSLYRKMRDWHLSQGEHEAAIECGERATEFEAQGLTSNPPELSSIDNPLRGSEVVAAVWNDRFQRMERKVIEYSMAQAIQEFLDFKRSTVAGEIMTPDSWEALRCHLQIADNFRGGNSVALTEIDEQYVQSYYLWLTQQVVKKNYSAHYAHSIFGSFKQFVRYQWGLRRLELPRNLDERRLIFKRKRKAIILWDKEEIGRFMLAANDRTRLYGLLALNCGFYSTDIATLTAEEVDFNEGRITRKRHKTEDQATAPVVSWKLWPETLQLLLQERNPAINCSKAGRKNQLVLLNDEGRPLRTAELKGNKFHKSDNVRSAIGRVCRKLKLDKSPKQFRKTSASMLEQHEVYGRYAQHFLGHAPSSVAARHYVLPSQEQFDRALEWLRIQLGIGGKPDNLIRKYPA